MKRKGLSLCEASTICQALLVFVLGFNQEMRYFTLRFLSPFCACLLLHKLLPGLDHCQISLQPCHIQHKLSILVPERVTFRVCLRKCRSCGVGSSSIRQRQARCHCIPRLRLHLLQARWLRPVWSPLIRLTCSWVHAPLGSKRGHFQHFLQLRQLRAGQRLLRPSLAS